MSTLVFESDDLSETEEFLSHAYGRMRISSSTPGPSHATIRREATPCVTVDECDLSFDMTYSTNPLHRICLCLVHEGTVRSHSIGDSIEALGPGDVASLASPELPSYGRICSARYNITMLEPDLLSQVATRANSREPQPVRLTGHLPHSAAAARQLRSTIHYLRDHVLAEPAVANQPLIISTATQLLAASVLSAFPNTARTDPSASDRNDAHPRTLRRALTYMDDHVGEPITLADIAGAAHVTIRSLQYAFRRHLDTTPLAHLRRMRLACAHHDLLAASPSSGTTVTDIAMRWGFFHVGRFAALYRETYGCPPRQDLRTSTAVRTSRSQSDDVPKPVALI
ncbi:helix-turn-helix domain-containing protein [Streptomyces sp. L2]|uniref:helix-turn-helix domain-containing protein n=1 Tax=Streptomyces sp. L2 TaxID=2162665 RepID=UPI001011A448|nr:helix-turn-helix domain-containing protein [Streptomyces sp. L2]